MAKTIKQIESIIEQGPFQATWDSLQRKETPKWFLDSKFGIFIHWGLYSIPAFQNEWYSRNMYIEGSVEYLHHIETYGPHKQFGYKDFIPLFQAEKFDPNEWATIIRESGAKYVFPVAEHHEGFQMYKSDISHWNSYEMGPKRDILGELKHSMEQEEVILCTSSHRAEHWFFMNGGTKFSSDLPSNMKIGDFYWPAMEEKEAYDFHSEPAPSKEFLEDWLMRTVEIIDNYQPKLLYLDWWVQHVAFKPYLKKLAAYYYNVAKVWDLDVMICYKTDAMAFGCGIVEIERGKFSEVKHFPWQTDTAIANNSWCYTNTLEYKTTNEILTMLVDVVSKNGNLLLNIGPKGDGSIPEYEVNLLKEVGNWLKTNQAAIYGSKPYQIYKEGPTEEQEGKFSEGKQEYTSKDFRFTSNHGKVYAVAMNPKNCQIFQIQTLRKATSYDTPGIFSDIVSISLLGYDGPLQFTQTSDSLTISIDKSDFSYPIVFEIELS